MTEPKKTRFDRMMEYLQANADGEGDRELIELFNKYRSIVSQHYEACVPDNQEWMKWTPDKCPRAQVHGPYFHKGFRQMDITDTGQEDSRIYALLSGWSDGPTSNTFWSAHDESMKDDTYA